MKSTPPSSSLLLLLLSHLLLQQPCSAQLFDRIFGDRCPRGQNDPGYYLDLTQRTVGKTSYLDYIPDDTAQGSVERPGKCTTSYVTYSSIETELQNMVSELDAGTARRFNDLGDIRISKLPFDCNNDPPWSDGYCGIATGMPTDDHVIVRPFLDEVLGDLGGSSGGDQTADGLRWSKAGLLASAQEYLAQVGDTMDTSRTPQLWVIQQVHKAAMDIDLTDDQTQEIADLFQNMLIRAAAPLGLGKIVPLRYYNDLKLRRKYIEMYEAAIRALIESGGIVSLVDEGDNVKLAAWTMFDIFCFAAAPPIPIVLRGALGAYYEGLVDESLDLTTHTGMGRVVFEAIRVGPPVWGASWIDNDDDRRSLVLVGLSGFDESVWGSDARDFRIRGDFAEYSTTLLNWMDAALPLPGLPHTSHVCPAKSFSFNLIVAFLLAMNPETWRPVDLPDVPAPGGNGWGGFDVTRV